MHTLVLLTLLFTPLGQASESKQGLHAHLEATRGYYGDMRLETLSFHLMNDSDKILDSAKNTWTLIIDGRVAPDPGGQFWMGGQPPGGYRTVPPGRDYRFGLTLPWHEYFPEPRDYTIYWKAAGFRSNTVVIRGGETP
jgi:hypothetical protein